MADGFELELRHDSPWLVGARWWQQSVRLVDLERRRTMFQIAAGAGGLAAGAALLRWATDDEPRDALELQQSRGWDVYAGNVKLHFPGARETDAAGSTAWRGDLESVHARLAPGRADLQPFYVPTLLRSLGERDLREQMRPVLTPPMEHAFAVGAALRMAALDGAPEGLGLIVDLPGPEAVALAAGLARTFEPVFLFDSWPHPAGVVPAHHTLAAVVYHLPTFQDAAELRGEGPPAFVLDANRLREEASGRRVFDNRYVAKLPGPDGMRAAGVRELLHVVSREPREQDDLNEAFVELEEGGVPVKMVAVSDFRPVPPGTRLGWAGLPAAGALWAALRGGWPPAGATSGAVSWRPRLRPTMFSRLAGGRPAGFGKERGGCTWRREGNCVPFRGGG